MASHKRSFSKKRTVVISLILALTLVFSVWGLTGCSKTNFSSEADIDSISKQTSASLPLPTDGSTPADHNPTDNIFYAFTALSNEDSFSCTSAGETVTKVAIANVSQKIKASRIVKNGEVYKNSVSHSSFKGVGVQTFVKGDNYVVLNANKVNSVDSVSWDGVANKISKDDFIAKYGFIANSITAYVMTTDTILQSEYLGEENGVYSFRYTLDPVKSTGKLSLEMRTMAGSQSLPVFNSASLTVRMDKNWRVLSTTTGSVYQVDMLGGVTCTENVTETFNYDNVEEIPNADFFRSYIDKEVVEVAPQELTALDYLMEGFSSHLTGQQPLKVSLDVTGSQNIPLALAGELELNINIDDLSKLSVSAMLDTVNYNGLELNDVLIGYAEEVAYVNYSGLKAKGSINEIGAVANRLLPLFNKEMPDLSNVLGSIDAQSLLANAKLEKGEGTASVTLPITLGELDIAITLNFTDGDSIAFVDGNISLAGLNVSIAKDDTLTIPQIEKDKYNSIAPLFDVVDQDGKITANVAIGDKLNALVALNLIDMSADINIGDIRAKYLDGTIYLDYKGFKAKLAVEDIDVALDKLAPILDGKVELPDFKALTESIDVMAILDKALASLEITTTENAVFLSANVDSIAVNITLNVENGGYTLGNINIAIKDTSINVAPSTSVVNAISNEAVASYPKLITLLDLIDEQNKINLQATLGETQINACIDLTEMSILVEVNLADSPLVIKIVDNKAYASYIGINGYIDLNDIETVITQLKPIINKFAGDSLDALSDINLSSFESLDVQQILSSLCVTENNGFVTINVDLSGIDVALILSTMNGELSFDSAIATFGDTQINVEKSSVPLTCDLDTTKEYIDLRTLVDTFDEALVNMLTKDQIKVDFNLTLGMGNNIFNIKNGIIKLSGLTTSAPKAFVTFDVEEIKTDKNGAVTTANHTITLIYLDPSLVAEGQTNTYFVYDNHADEAVFEGKFTTTKFNVTIEILKQIYANMPELQDTLKPILIPDENGMPTLPEMDIELSALINGFTFANNALTADINGNAFFESLPMSLLAILSAENGALTASIPSVALDGLSLSLNFTVNVPEENEITDQTFTYTASANAKDFSSINELLETLKNTSKQRSFNIKGDIDMAIDMALFSIDIKDKVHIDVKLDVIDGKTYAVVELAREHVASAWKDYDGVATLYFDPVDQMIYIKNVYRTKVLFANIYTTHYEYSKYTVEEFTADMITPLLSMIRLAGKWEKLITDAMAKEKTNTTPVTIENTFTGYSYNGTDTFTINLDLEALTSDLRDVTVNIGHDENMNVNSLNASLDIMGIMSIKLDATLASPYDQYQKTDLLIQAEKDSGEYK